MKIGIDARSFGAKVCGVSRVTIRLIEALSQIDKKNSYVVFSDTAQLPGVFGDNFSVVRTKCPRMNPFFDPKFCRIVADARLDVFHSVHSWLPFGIERVNVAKLVTIHDIFAVTDPDFFSKYHLFSGFARTYFGYLTSRSAKIADMILTVSEYSRRRIEAVIPAARGKTEVVYNASGMDLSAQLKRTASSPTGRYILYVGNCRSYKNVPTLVRGFSAYLSSNQDSDLSLVIAGNSVSPEVKSLVQECGISAKVIFHANPDDSHLRDLYAGALAFVLPSKEEGFGIPVIEAMSVGIPVIISDAEALVEVAGDAALTFPKGEHLKLAALIRQIEKDPALRSDLSRRGITRALAFSWAQSAEKLVKCYLNSVSVR